MCSWPIDEGRNDYDVHSMPHLPATSDETSQRVNDLGFRVIAESKGSDKPSAGKALHSWVVRVFKRRPGKHSGAVQVALGQLEGVIADKKQLFTGHDKKCKRHAIVKSLVHLGYTPKGKKEKGALAKAARMTLNREYQLSDQEREWHLLQFPEDATDEMLEHLQLDTQVVNIEKLADVYADLWSRTDGLDEGKLLQFSFQELQGYIDQLSTRTYHHRIEGTSFETVIYYKEAIGQLKSCMKQKAALFLETAREQPGGLASLRFQELEKHAKYLAPNSLQREEREMIASKTAAFNWIRQHTPCCERGSYTLRFDPAAITRLPYPKHQRLLELVTDVIPEEVSIEDKQMLEHSLASKESERAEHEEYKRFGRKIRGSFNRWEVLASFTYSQMHEWREMRLARLGEEDILCGRLAELLYEKQSAFETLSILFGFDILPTNFRLKGADVQRVSKDVCAHYLERHETLYPEIPEFFRVNGSLLERYVRSSSRRSARSSERSARPPERIAVPQERSSIAKARDWLKQALGKLPFPAETLSQQRIGVCQAQTIVIAGLVGVEADFAAVHEQDLATKKGLEKAKKPIRAVLGQVLRKVHPDKVGAASSEDEETRRALVVEAVKTIKQNLQKAST